MPRTKKTARKTASGINPVSNGTQQQYLLTFKQRRKRQVAGMEGRWNPQWNRSRQRRRRRLQLGHMIRRLSIRIRKNEQKLASLESHIKLKH